MIIDIHAHIVGTGTGISGTDHGMPRRPGLLFRLFLRKIGIAWKDMSKPGADQMVRRKIVRLIEESCIDRVMILALDGSYGEDGQLDESRTQLVIPNDYIADLASENEKLLFGASIHPFRPDALAELDRVAERGACLVKWLPSAQGIQPDHARCFPFYDRLASLRLPLLCHTGNEHTLTGGDNGLNDPRRLVPALERGVTVIAAHCGARMYLHERCLFKAWKQMALTYPNCFGDLGACVLPTRIHHLRSLRKDPRLLAQVLYGSDFPAIPITMSTLFELGIQKTLLLRKIKNPIEAPYRILKAMGFPDEVFTKAQDLIRMPPAKTVLSGSSFI